MREYEIGSEAWVRERLEHGLDPGEGDRPEDEHLLGVELEPADLAGHQAEGYSV